MSDIETYKELASAADDSGEASPRLNAEQLECVTTTEGFVRVIAGAGTGKTRALTERFAYLVNEIGILPSNILCVTFTNKAANEMRRRIRRLTGDNDTGYINTFHGFCVTILREDSHAVGYPKNFVVLDESDIDSMLKMIYEERHLTLRDMTFSHARDMIEMIKIKERPAYYLDMLAIPLEDLRRKYLEAQSVKDIIFYGYLYQEKKCFALDYNDLIAFVLHIFREYPDIRQKWQQRLEYIMIDEYQDMDAELFGLVEVLCAFHGNLFVVGDPDQTIYSWRGADIRFLLEFDKRFPSAKTIMLLKNYRSVPAVLSVANSLIDKNNLRVKKELVATRAQRGPTVWHHAASSDDEAAWIAQGVHALHGEGVAFRDIAILYRAHYASRPVEERLLKERIPHVVYSGVPFFARREIKDALSYLRLIAFRDDLSFARVVNVPKRNIGNRRQAYLRDYAASHDCTLLHALELTVEDEIFRGTKAKAFLDLVNRFSDSCCRRSASEVLADVLNVSGYERMLRTEGSQDRLDNIAELKQSVHEFEASCGEETSLEDYLRHVALFTNADAYDSAEDKVKLMTIHAAKGLEFKHVFLCSLSEGVLPSRKTDTPQAMEEERRLCFVALTRARDGLYLSEAEGFNHQGGSRYPSRFLLDIDPQTLQFSNRPTDTQLDDARGAYAMVDRRLVDAQAVSRIAPGTRILHSVFGEGVVCELDDVKRAYIVDFESLDTPRAISFRADITVVDR